MIGWSFPGTQVHNGEFPAGEFDAGGSGRGPTGQLSDQPGLNVQRDQRTLDATSDHQVPLRHGGDPLPQ
jgi:hypothetical protein